MPRQLILQAPGFRQVGEQHQLARLALQRAGGNRQAPTVFQGDLVAIVLTRSEVARNDLPPEHAEQRQTEQIARHRVGLTHHALAVDDDDPARQQIQQALQALGQALLLGQFLHALGADQGQLPLQLGDPVLQHAVGLTELSRHLVEAGKSLLQAGAAGRLLRSRRLEFSML
ncbi:hypothetical protein D9M68_863880 [compost metagenome]